MESAIPLASSGTTRRISWRKPWVLTAALVTALIIISGIFLYRLHDGWGAPPRTSLLTQIAQAIRSRLPQALASNAVSLRKNDDHSRLAIRVDGMFAPGKYALNEASVPLVAQVGQAIAAGRANVLVHLTGYTDDTPFESAGLSNRTLSALRAQTVMQVLTNAGVSPERITVNGNGESSPLDDNHTREGRARNRRVEIVVEQWP